MERLNDIYSLLEDKIREIDDILNIDNRIDINRLASCMLTMAQAMYESTLSQEGAAEIFYCAADDIVAGTKKHIWKPNGEKI